jgi:hypothetical protein
VLLSFVQSNFIEADKWTGGFLSVFGILTFGFLEDYMIHRCIQLWNQPSGIGSTTTAFSLDIKRISTRSFDGYCFGSEISRIDTFAKRNLLDITQKRYQARSFVFCPNFGQPSPGLPVKQTIEKSATSGNIGAFCKLQGDLQHCRHTFQPDNHAFCYTVVS